MIPKISTRVDILGIINSKDMFKAYFLGQPIKLNQIMRPVIRVIESIPVQQLLILNRNAFNDSDNGPHDLIQLYRLAEKISFKHIFAVDDP